MIDFNPDLVMANFTQSMLGFFQLIIILGFITVGFVCSYLYIKKMLNEAK
jgi:hypothetical protein